MAHTVDSSNISVATRRTLLTLNKRFTWRQIAEAYGVNVKYVHQWAKDGKKPTNPEVLEKMGLKKKPKPPTFFQVKRDAMAAETKRVTKGWRVQP